MKWDRKRPNFPTFHSYTLFFGFDSDHKDDGILGMRMSGDKILAKIPEDQERVF